MAAKHVRAVQEYSKVDNYRSLVVLMAIATDIGANDQPAFTSLKTIARRCRCSINLVRKITDELIESGELIKEKKGKYTQYSLNNELIPTQADKVEDDDLQCGPPPKSTKTDSDVDQNNELDHIKKTLEIVSKNQSELYSLISSIVSQSYHDSIEKSDNRITTVSKGMTSNDTKEEKGVRREVEKDIKRESDKNISPPSYQNFELITQGIPPKLKYLKPHIDAILKVTRKNKHNQRIIEFASIYHEGEIPPQAILDYFIGDNSKWNTESFGKDGQVPYVGHLESEYGNLWAWYKQGCPAPKVKQAHTNGHSPVLNAKFDSGGGW